MGIYFSVESRPCAGFSLITSPPALPSQTSPSLGACSIPPAGRAVAFSAMRNEDHWLSRWAHLAKCPHSSCTRTKSIQHMPLVLLPATFDRWPTRPSISLSPAPTLPTTHTPASGRSSLEDGFEHRLCACLCKTLKIQQGIWHRPSGEAFDTINVLQSKMTSVIKKEGSNVLWCTK